MTTVFEATGASRNTWKVGSLGGFEVHCTQSCNSRMRTHNCWMDTWNFLGERQPVAKPHTKLSRWNGNSWFPFSDEETEAQRARTESETDLGFQSWMSHLRFETEGKHTCSALKFAFSAFFSYDISWSPCQCSLPVPAQSVRSDGWRLGALVQNWACWSPGQGFPVWTCHTGSCWTKWVCLCNHLCGHSYSTRSTKGAPRWRNKCSRMS